jgi:hypothetical protein
MLTCKEICIMRKINKDAYRDAHAIVYCLCPDVEHLRSAIANHGIGCIPPSIYPLAWDAERTIGEVVASPEFSAEHAPALHRILTEHASMHPIKG